MWRKFGLSSLPVALCYVAFTILYLISAVLLYERYTDSSSHLSFTFLRTVAYVFDLSSILLVVLISFVFYFFGGRSLAIAAAPLLLIILGQAPFFAAFNIVKLLAPVPNGFWADIVLADIDHWLHGGMNAWRAYDIAFGWILPDWLVVSFYFPIWMTVAYAFPAFVFALERDARVATRYLLLFILTWVLLGNLFATLLASAGPVYFANVTGRDDFVFLTQYLAENNDIFAGLNALQAQLWQEHSAGVIGAGVSAMPSLHVAAATLPTIYVIEKWGWRASPVILFPAIIQYGSVRSGFHYGLDGYFSLIFVLLLHAVLKRLADRASQSSSAVTAASLTTEASSQS